MSRIGKKFINIPEKVKVELNGQKISVDGPKGNLSRILPSLVCCTMEDNKLIIEKTQDSIYIEPYLNYIRQYLMEVNYNDYCLITTPGILNNLIPLSDNKVINIDGKDIFEFRLIYSLNNYEKSILFPQYNYFNNISVVIARQLQIKKLSSISFFNIIEMTKNEKNETTNSDNVSIDIFKNLYLIFLIIKYYF